MQEGQSISNADTTGRSSLISELFISAIFVFIGIVFSGSQDPMAMHFIGAAIGYGFGFATHALFVFRASRAKSGK